MDYRIITANGENENDITVTDVESIDIKEEAYVFYGHDKKMIFSSPLESTVYLVKLK